MMTGSEKADSPMLFRLIRRPSVAVTLIALLGVVVVAHSQDAERLKQQRESLQWQVIRPVVRGERAAVGAGTPLVSEAAMRILHNGGNAVDAGVASLFAGAVTEFSHFGFGGEAPLLIRTPDAKTLCISGLGQAPKLMMRDFFLSRRANPEIEQEAQRRGREQGPIPSYGILPAVAPGMVDGGLLALKQFGTKSFEEVIQPAVQLADGHPIDDMRARSIASATRFLRRFPTSRNVFLGNGMLPRPGDVFRQPDLARTIRSMIAAEQKALKAGKTREQAIDAIRDHFYRGDIARRIGDFSKSNGGLLRYEDLAEVRMSVEEPLTTTFFGFEVHKAGFWTQGAVMIQALNILEGYPLTELGWNSPEYLHYITEALKLAYADRDAWYGDPNFTKVPERLLTKAYAAERRALIDPYSASTKFRPGEVGDRPAMHPATHVGQLRPLTDALASKDTTAINVIDKDGWMFSATPSGAWMPSVIAGDTGIPLTQRAQSFVMMAGHPNVVEPGKRPRITLSPTIVTRQGEPIMALSTPGGDQQDQALLQVMLAALLFGFDPQAAVEAPRIQTRHLAASFDDHAMEPNKLLLDERIPESVLDALLDRGHDIERRSRWDSGSAPVALKVLRNGVIEAGADPYGFRYADAW
jgi:gamma-glutamyltranspeptidase/glutathione hydrolase